MKNEHEAMSTEDTEEDLRQAKIAAEREKRKEAE